MNGQPVSDVPARGMIQEIRKLTADTWFFVIGIDGSFPNPRPGQFVQLSCPGGGEFPVSVAAGPDSPLELCIRRAGRVTAMLFEMRRGDEVGIRGPFGNGFPLAEMRGRDVLMIAGGVGIPPLRSLLLHLSADRKGYGRISLVYGAADTAALLFREELEQQRAHGAQITLCSENECLPPQGVLPGLVTKHLGEISRSSCAAVCGPHAMYRPVAAALMEQGLSADALFLALERRMQCGVGHCCHCVVGDRFCCTDGPVFRYSEIPEDER